MTDTAQTGILDAITEYGTAERQSGSYPYSDLYEREAKRAYEALVASIGQSTSKLQAEIERLKTENAKLKSAVKTLKSGYTYETPEMTALRRKHIEDSEREIEEETAHNLQYERQVRQRQQAFREEYKRLEHEALTQLLNAESAPR